MAAVAGVSLTTPKIFANASDSPKVHTIKFSLLNSPWKRYPTTQFRRMYVRPVAAAPDKLSEKVEESIKNAKEACSEDPASGECVAAWDEVEELSAAASHARDKKKESDPLENYNLLYVLDWVCYCLQKIHSREKKQATAAKRLCCTSL